jgi:DNA-binding GntR family transcriptional regulator
MRTMNDTTPTVLPKQRIAAVSAARQVAEALRDLILRGELGPGAALEEAPMAATFGVSRNTVREAIRNLAQAGLVTQSRLRPAVVVSLTAETVVDVFHVRRLLELDAARTITDRGGSELPAVDRAFADLSVLDGSDDWHRLAVADFGFHAAIVEDTGSARMVRTYESIGTEVLLCLSLTDRWDTSPKDQLKQHRSIREYLTAGDWKSVERLLGAHIDDARERVLSVLDRVSDSPEEAQP